MGHDGAKHKDTAAPGCWEEAEGGEKGKGGAQGCPQVLGMSQFVWKK